MAGNKLIKITLRSLALIAIACYLLFWHYNVRPMNSEGDWIPYETLVTTFLTIVVMSVLFGLLFALVPLKGTKYRSRLLNAICIGAIFACLLFGFSKYNSGPHYYYMPEASSCASIKTGHFRVDDMDIVRTIDHQTQTDLKTGDKNEFRVVWLSECEYKLFDEGGKSRSFKVAVADSSGYTCYGHALGRTSRPIRVDRVGE